MELSELIIDAFDRVKQANIRATADLSPEQLLWRPGGDCNSIGFILLHQARSEDDFIQTKVRGKTQVWESEQWYKKLGLPLKETTGTGYTAEQLANFRVPALKDLLGYADAVRVRTVEYLQGKNNDFFNTKVTVTAPPWGEITIGALLTRIIIHLSRHVGEISYLRGMQLGMNK